MVLRERLQNTRFTLALSAGFFGFFAHAGFVSALEEAKLVPARITGASAGALVGGLWAAGLDARALRDELAILKREHFWDPAFGWGLLRGDLFRKRVESLLSARTFDRLRMRAALSVWDVRTRTTRVRDTGDLAEAICASCALPGLFHPVRIDDRLYLDGGIADRPAHASIEDDETVLYHHLSSKSPWRSRAPEIPPRARTIPIVIENLPRLGPFRLERGMEAFEHARDRMRVALDRPMQKTV